MRQLSLLPEPPTDAPAEPCDPNVEEKAKPRLRGQNARILARLKEGPVTNISLASISLKYTSRISDLRKAGYTIICTGDEKRRGVNWYRLEEQS